MSWGLLQIFWQRFHIVFKHGKSCFGGAFFFFFFKCGKFPPPQETLTRSHLQRFIQFSEQIGVDLFHLFSTVSPSRYIWMSAIHPASVRKEKKKRNQSILCKISITWLSFMSLSNPDGFLSTVEIFISFSLFAIKPLIERSTA